MVVTPQLVILLLITGTNGVEVSIEIGRRFIATVIKMEDANSGQTLLNGVVVGQPGAIAPVADLTAAIVVEAHRQDIAFNNAQRL